MAQDIDEDTGPLDLKLAPGLTLAGRRGIRRQTCHQRDRHADFLEPATAACHLTGLTAPPTRRAGLKSPPCHPDANTASSSPLRVTDKSRSTMSDASAEAGRMELDPFELKPANLKLAGQVLDADDKPVAGCQRESSTAKASPTATRALTARDNFTSSMSAKARLKSRPTARIPSATFQPKAAIPTSSCGSVKPTTFGPGANPHKLKGTVTDADGKPAAGAQVAVFPYFNGSALDKDRRPTARSASPGRSSRGKCRIRRRAAGGPRPRPQSGGHRGVGGGHHQPRREIETGPDRRRAGQKY